jgi:osmoprotectant transport system permease protein
VALLVRAALDAFDSVDEDLRQAAVAMGFKPLARFVQIDLPLSLPVMFAGLRVVSVSNISLVSVAALLGIGNLGMLFTSGLQRDFVTEVVVGIIAILILALFMDAVLVLLERLLTPWTRASRPAGTARPAAGDEASGPRGAPGLPSTAKAGGTA